VTPSLVAFFLWAIAANVLALIPSRDSHWTRAYLLIGLGVPLLVWLWVQNGLVIAALACLAGASILRWPLYFLTRWLRRILGWSDRSGS